MKLPSSVSRLLGSCGIFLWLAFAPTAGAEVRVITDAAYKTGASVSEYERQRCRLDWYLPENVREFPTLVWIHGGGLTEGAKDSGDTRDFARKLAEGGVAVASINYRLSPQALYPAYLDDAAAAVAWVRAHVSEHGGSDRRVYLGGHSAGGYVALMVGLDPRFLAKHQLGLDALAGLVPVSGQTMTHYTVRVERGLPKNVIIADEAAPIHHVRKDAPPVLVLWAENDLPARAEENTYLIAALRAAGHEHVRNAAIPDRDHGTIISKIAAPDDQVARHIIEFLDGR